MESCKAKPIGVFAPAPRLRWWPWPWDRPWSTSGNNWVPTSHQNKNVSAASASTIQVKRPAQRSARACIGALLAWARCTSSIKRAKAESAPLRKTSKSRGDCRLRPPAESSVPTCTKRGIGSPVKPDSSTLEQPEITLPSTGRRSPGKIRKRSPGLRPPTRTGRGKSSPTSSRAVLGCRSARASRASPVRRLARSSRKRPSSTKPSSIKGSLKKQDQPTPGQIKATRLAR